MQPTAFDDQVRDLTGPVRSYIHAKVPADAVDDVLQETLSSLWAATSVESASDLEAGRVRALAYRVADRRVADYWRSTARHERRLGALRRFGRRQPATAPSAQDVILSSVPPEWLHELSTEALEVLLRVADGASVQEIARDLGISPNAVSSRLKRLRERTSQLVAEGGRDED